MTGTASLATVTVTYRPELVILRKQLDQLPRDALRIVVDNASPEPLRVCLRTLVAEEGAVLIENDANLGLAAATNIGVAHALRAGVQRVLFLDQDTEPGVTGVADLCAAHDRLHTSDPRPSCIGPRLIDFTTGLDHGFHQQRGWRWVRVWPPRGAPPVPCVNLNGSGTLVPSAILVALGGLEDDLFIDHVDTEWAFRVLAAGFGLYGAPDVAFGHRMGEKTWRFWWWGWRVWPYRSPLRHRYLFRNAVRLMHRPYVPRVFKTWAVVKLLVTFCVHALFDSARAQQTRAMLQGVADGWRAERTGKSSD
ncbi:glycosyltransferase [Frateuria soli]|uniref:glycosyltransferase n=1 Tax=Frateuria soli TaxID=1542730 RepID=UPI001E38AB63|nr:glycosyltransferase [Frateuria soli]UGB38978.1 glycosyltransferase family 2 protein [Frateuria soli]